MFVFRDRDARSRLSASNKRRCRSEDYRLYFEEFFGVVEVLPISNAVLDQAVALRQMRRMTLGDAIMAATALVYGITLVTRNIDDFRWIAELTLINPFEA